MADVASRRETGRLSLHFIQLLRNSTLRALRYGDIKDELLKGFSNLKVLVYPEMKQVIEGACKNNLPYYTFTCREATNAIRLYLQERTDKYGFRDEAETKGLSNHKILKKITKKIAGIDLHPFAAAMAKVNYLLAISDLLSPKITPAELQKLELPVYWSDSLASFGEVKVKESGAPVREVRIMPFEEGLPLPDPSEIGWSDIFENLEIAGLEGWKERMFFQKFPKGKRLKYKMNVVLTISDL